jgi:hypothetical protein
MLNPSTFNYSKKSAGCADGSCETKIKPPGMKQYADLHYPTTAGQFSAPYGGSDADKVKSYVQTVDLGGIHQSTTVGTHTDSALDFQLNDLTNAAAMAALYDQYRIRMIEIEVTPRANGYSAVTNYTSNTNFADLYCVIDLDDATALTQNSDYSQYENCITLKPWEAHTFVIYPRTAQAMYNGAFTAFGSAPPSQWIDTVSNTVQYYGFKCGVDSIQNAAQAQQAAWHLRARYHIEFRNVK